ncbi:hypothetical protein DPEC_G00075500 [Dallia pectoralis]|uniref:Uncharacterized protein n=1 Tax=Dallia pectoralis TaxID=75939 RepID=A0ACC2H4K8_DALPE|nr:hypothetical protein DPEC_G00075500 [Dallia pectoralis]
MWKSDERGSDKGRYEGSRKSRTAAYKEQLIQQNRPPPVLHLPARCSNYPPGAPTSPARILTQLTPGCLHDLPGSVLYVNASPAFSYRLHNVTHPEFLTPYPHVPLLHNIVEVGSHGERQRVSQLPRKVTSESAAKKKCPSPESDIHNRTKPPATCYSVNAPDCGCWVLPDGAFHQGVGRYHSDDLIRYLEREGERGSGR